MERKVATVFAVGSRKASVTNTGVVTDTIDTGPITTVNRLAVVDIL